MWRTTHKAQPPASVLAPGSCWLLSCLCSLPRTLPSSWISQCQFHSLTSSPLFIHCEILEVKHPVSHNTCYSLFKWRFCSGQAASTGPASRTSLSHVLIPLGFEAGRMPLHFTEQGDHTPTSVCRTETSRHKVLTRQSTVLFRLFFIIT